MAWWRHYTPKPPREVKGGIKAQSKRGAFGNSWWAKRWLLVLVSFDIGERLSRGRSYAREGQVLDIEIEKGAVRAKVQGSRSRPYEVKILIWPLSRAKWYQVVKALSVQFIYGAKLLAGEMPEDIETVFEDAKLSLFPHQLRDLETDCTCPDWSNPCKHVAAVCYLLGEEFDRDPFLIFKLRGLDREELFEMMGYSPSLPSVLEGHAQKGVSVSALENQPLEFSAFWGGEDLPDDLFGEVSLPEVPAALPKRLGSFPFWRGKAPFFEALEPLYLQAAPAGLDVFLGLTKAPVEEAPAPDKPMKPAPKSAKIFKKKSPQGARVKKNPPREKTS